MGELRSCRILTSPYTLHEDQTNQPNTIKMSCSINNLHRTFSDADPLFLNVTQQLLPDGTGEEHQDSSSPVTERWNAPAAAASHTSFFFFLEFTILNKHH